VLLGGKIEIELEEMLTPEEADYIRESSINCIDVPNMQVNLERKFSGRSFHFKLLHRMRTRVLDNEYGTDGMQLKPLFEKGQIICQDGRVFEIIPSDDFRIESIRCQTRLVRECATIF